MAISISLSDAIDEYVVHRKANNKSYNTIRANTRSLKLLLSELGNIQVRHFNATHGDRFRQFLTGKGYKPNSVNSHIDSINGFVKWAHARGYLPKGNDPMALVSRADVQRAHRNIVLPEDFPALLDAAHSFVKDTQTGKMVEVGSAHDRIVTALGLFLFLRQSEIMTLRYGYVDLDRGEILVQIHKDPTKPLDVMPIGEELDAELRRWLTWYANDTKDSHGPLQKSWYLVPRRNPHKLVRVPGSRYGVPERRQSGICMPMLHNARPHENVKRTLVRFGLPITDEGGDSLMEGVHTLRRSGARAWFEMLTEQKAYDGALRQVAAMLHHKQTSTTEVYLQISVDKKVRNELIRGKRMFPKPVADNVIPLRAVDDDAAEN
jgi:integrase